MSEIASAGGQGDPRALQALAGRMIVAIALALMIVVGLAIRRASNERRVRART